MDKKIKLLREYFKKKPSVVLAFVFGSYVKGLAGEESDFDVAVYLISQFTKPEKIRDVERKIWFEVSKIVEKEVDLVCLNNAPASLISNIFKSGIPLKIGDKKLYWELYLTKSTEAEDFLNFVEDFWEIKKRAKSLAKEEKERLVVRVDYLNDELGRLDRFKKLRWEEYLNNWDERKIVERWVENIISALIDIAKIVLASEKKKMPKSYGDALYYFGLLARLNKEEAEKFSEFSSLRNILAHEYLEVLYERIEDFIKEFPKPYEKVFKFLEDYLK